MHWSLLVLLSCGLVRRVGCHIHLRLLRFNIWASILLSWSLIQGALGSKDLLGVCQIVAGLVSQWFRIVSVKFSGVTQIAIASADKFWALSVRRDFSMYLFGGLINFHVKVNLAFKATLLDLITYLVCKVSFLTSWSPKTYRHLTHSIRRIQDHSVCFLGWCYLLIWVSRPICVSSDI
jgi:hypothetical protein